MQSLVQGLPKDDEAIVSFLDKTWHSHPVAQTRLSNPSTCRVVVNSSSYFRRTRFLKSDYYIRATRKELSLLIDTKRIRSLYRILFHIIGCAVRVKILKMAKAAET